MSQTQQSRRTFKPRGNYADFSSNELAKINAARAVIRKQIAGAQRLHELSGGTLGEIQNAPLACLPSSIPATRTRPLPMTEDEFEVDFGPEFSLIPENAPQQSTGLISKLTQGGTPLAPFFLRAVCVLFRADPAAWALIGATVTRPSAPGTLPIRTPRVIPVGGVPDDPNAEPAVFSWNHDTVQGVMDLLLSFQFQYLLQGRFLMINERAMDVGLIDSHTCTQGFGTAHADPGLIIEEANRYLGTLGTPWVFQPPNVTAVGTPEEPAGLPLEPNLVKIQYVTPVAPGVFGVCYPVRPHVLFPGQNYQFLFTRVAESEYYNRLKQRWTFSTDLQKVDPNFADSRPAGAGGPAVWGGYRSIRYSLMQYGTLLRGAEVLPEECLQWMLMFGQPYMSLYNDPGMVNAINNLVVSCGLQGLPVPLGPRGVDKRWNKTNAIQALFEGRVSDDGALAGFGVSERRIERNELRRLIQELAAPEPSNG